MGKNLKRAMKKLDIKANNTVPIEFTIVELEALYGELSFINAKRPNIMRRVVKKLQYALLARVLEHARAR